MSLLTQAMQPDKIFDLPLALVKVQQAFQQSNTNAERLKESLEIILAREQALIQELTEARQEKRQIEEKLEQDKVQLTTQFKDQLITYSQSVKDLQAQLEDRDGQIREMQALNFELRTQNDTQRDKIVILDNQRQMFQSQVQRKTKDFDELRQQFEYLRKAEDESAGQLDKVCQRATREESRLR